jgi:hypothetical protein
MGRWQIRNARAATDNRRQLSATLENPFDTLKNMEGMEEMLSDRRAGSYAPIIVCVHYASPHIEYLDRGKSRISLE